MHKPSLVARNLRQIRIAVNLPNINPSSDILLLHTARPIIRIMGNFAKQIQSVRKIKSTEKTRGGAKSV